VDSSQAFDPGQWAQRGRNLFRQAEQRGAIAPGDARRWESLSPSAPPPAADPVEAARIGDFGPAPEGAFGAVSYALRVQRRRGALLRERHAVAKLEERARADADRALEALGARLGLQPGGPDTAERQASTLDGPRRGEALWTEAQRRTLLDRRQAEEALEAARARLRRAREAEAAAEVALRKAREASQAARTRAMEARLQGASDLARLQAEAGLRKDEATALEATLRGHRSARAEARRAVGDAEAELTLVRRAAEGESAHKEAQDSAREAAARAALRERGLQALRSGAAEKQGADAFEEVVRALEALRTRKAQAALLDAAAQSYAAGPYGAGLTLLTALGVAGFCLLLAGCYAAL
jgi:hypothetical protein